MASSDVRLVPIDGPEEAGILFGKYDAAPPLDVLRERIEDAIHEALTENTEQVERECVIWLADAVLRVIVGDAREDAS